MYFNISEEDLFDLSISLEDILAFVTGSAHIPRLGFASTPTISFNHPDEQEKEHLRGLPIVSTCAMQIALPVVESYDMFEKTMVECIKHASFFSRA